MLSGDFRTLRYLFLQAVLRQVRELPNLSENVNLRRVHLEAMKGLRDLKPLTTAAFPSGWTEGA